MLVKTLDSSTLVHLEKQFKAIDLDNSGLIDAAELLEALKKVHLEGSHIHSDQEISKIIREIDYYGNGKINYSEFLAATLQVQTILTDQNLW